MSRIVVLSSIYLGKASTNGLCAQNIVEALTYMGHDVHVICYPDPEVTNESNIHSICYDQLPHKGLFRRLCERLKKVLFLAGSSPKFFLDYVKVNQYFLKLKDIESRNKIDAVVAMFFPLETVEALSLFKKSNKNIKSIIFELDSIFDGIAQGSPFYNLYDRSYKKWLSTVYNTVDDVIVMRSHMDSWEKNFAHSFHSKLHESDIPVLLPTPSITVKRKDVSFLYAGLLDRKYRSPKYLLSVLSELSKRNNFTFTFYSKGDCENMIATVSKENRNIRQMGYVKKEELEKAFNDAMFLINIGNSISNSVPSKLISYISYKKPIIHFSSQEDDICNFYLKEYPLSLIIRQENSIEESCSQIISFIEKFNNSDYNDLDIEEIFKMNTPKFSASLINSILNNN